MRGKFHWVCYVWLFWRSIPSPNIRKRKGKPGVAGGGVSYQRKAVPSLVTNSSEIAIPPPIASAISKATGTGRLPSGTDSQAEPLNRSRSVGTG